MSAGAAVALGVTAAGLALLVFAARRHQQHQLAGRPTAVQLQLAGSGSRLHTLLGALGADGRTAAHAALRADRWIIAGYVLLAGGSSALSVWAVRSAAAGTWRTVGTVVAIAVGVAIVIAAVLDAVENQAVGDALARWSDPPDQPVPPTEDGAAARQAHRRTLSAELHEPATRAARAARAKFTILFALWPAWMIAVSTICVTDALT